MPSYVHQYITQNSTHQEVLHAIASNTKRTCLKNASAEIKNDTHVILQALKKNQWAIKYADRSLRENASFIKKAAAISHHALQYASEKIQNTRAIVMHAVKCNARALTFAGEFKKDREIVLIALATIEPTQEDTTCRNHDLIETICTHFSDDHDIIMSLIKKEGRALRLVADKYSNNEEIIRVAINSHAPALRHASLEIRQNKSIVLAAMKNLKKNQYLLDIVGQTLRDDKEVVMEAVKAYPQLWFASERLKKDTEVVMQAITREPSELKNADVELKDNRLFILNAVRHVSCFFYVSARLKNDSEIALAAIKRHHNSYTLTGSQLRGDLNFHLSLLLLTHDKHTINYIEKDSAIFRVHISPVIDDLIAIKKSRPTSASNHEESTERFEKIRSDFPQANYPFYDSLDFSDEDLDTKLKLLMHVWKHPVKWLMIREVFHDNYDTTQGADLRTLELKTIKHIFDDLNAKYLDLVSYLMMPCPQPNTSSVQHPALSFFYQHGEKNHITFRATAFVSTHSLNTFVSTHPLDTTSDEPTPTTLSQLQSLVRDSLRNSQLAAACDEQTTMPPPAKRHKQCGV